MGTIIEEAGPGAAKPAHGFLGYDVPHLVPKGLASETSPRSGRHLTCDSLESFHPVRNHLDVVSDSRVDWLPVLRIGSLLDALMQSITLCGKLDRQSGLGAYV